MTINDIVSTLAAIAQQLEGPYKWYVIAGVALILTAIITRFIFKTLKWFFILLFIVALALGLIWGIGELAGQAGV